MVALLGMGCTMPGPYMSSGDVMSSGQYKNHQPKTTIIPISNPNDYARLVQYFSVPYEYRIGLYDVLSVVVVNHPELSSSNSNQISLVQPGQENNQYLSSSTSSNSNNATQGVGYYVDAQGEIVFPLIGNIQVAGLTTKQASQKIAKKLIKYIRSPMVSLKVTKFNSQRVHVLGEVMQPGIRPVGDRALSILDALSLAGGINSQTADMRHVFVLRSKGQNNILVYWLDSKSPSALLLAEHFRLLDNDIVYIPPAGVTDWNRFLNQVLPTVQTYWYTRSLVRN